MSERTEQLAAVLTQAEHVHGIVTAKTGGADPDWALFYAWWLLTWSDFPQVLGRSMSLAELTVELARLDAAYRAVAQAEPWAETYAAYLLDAVG